MPLDSIHNYTVYTSLGSLYVKHLESSIRQLEIQYFYICQCSPFSNLTTSYHLYVLDEFICNIHTPIGHGCIFPCLILQRRPPYAGHKHSRGPDNKVTEPGKPFHRLLLLRAATSPLSRELPTVSREIQLGFGFPGPAAMATEQATENYTVEDLVALNPYNPDILNDLEKFVNEQVNPSHRDAFSSACFLSATEWSVLMSTFERLRNRRLDG